ncbi:LysM peptidoglycan-binding domain-containing protein [Amycolatopsis sp. NPDC059657]|uniref:LysM peptidoglycan-binding domain-containing protein n=1 Tax=Amycolatopsis sp. NPDC059657 TaxID=3346899 RepID=UPI0036729CCE
MDVSHWNTVTDWNAIRGNGISFASLKLTEGSGYVDRTSGPRVAAARAAGVVPGGYHFARPGHVGAQVEHFISQLRATGLLESESLAPMLDMEDASLRASANDFIADFVAQLRHRAGIRKVLVYANLDWYTRTLVPDNWADEDVVLWIARYNGDPANPGWNHPRLAIHQHTQKGRVSGVAGNVDRNATMHGWTLADLTLDGSSSPADPAPTPDPPASGATYTVLPGDTLSAIARRFDTTVDVLASLNMIANPDRIYPGQVLRLPGAETGGGRYQVTAGDTLSAIAARFGTTVAVLVALNGIRDPNRIYAGQWLNLP